jgi:putative ABC transport system permease protein
MSFFGLLLKNLVRQKVRTSLTVLGICVGIATVVALGVITGGLKDMAADILRAGNSDFMVAQKGSSDLAFSSVSEADQQAIDDIPGVARTSGLLMHITRVGPSPYFVAMGITPEDLVAYGLQIESGKTLSPDASGEILLGVSAARAQGVSVGDLITIDNRDFRVVGTFQSGDAWQDGGGYLSLSDLQEIAGRPGLVTMVYVTVASGYTVNEVAQNINDVFANLTSVTGLDEYQEVDQGLRIMDAVNLAISLLAVGIGAIGVMNTMIMSVFERTREIGILKAVGWRNRRVLQLIIGESLFLCAIAAAVGILFGVLLSRAVMLIPDVGNFLTPSYTLDVFLRALAVAVIVALVGAAYPAVRAARMTPMEALRHE